MPFQIPESTIEEIRLRTDLADLISSYGISVKRSGSAYMACCPFHKEKTPSFSINPDKGFYHCFGCGESGDCFKFVMKYEGLTFSDAVKKLGGAAGIEIKERDDPEAESRKKLYALHAELAQFFRRCLKDGKFAEASPARRYLESRAISDECAEAFLIGYCPKSAATLQKWAEKNGFTNEDLAKGGILREPQNGRTQWYSPFGGRVVFTIRDRSGRAVGFSARTLEKNPKARKYVNSPATPIFVKSRILYALDAAAPNIAKDPARQALICEGQIDVIRCHDCGFKTAVASEGTSFTEQHVEILKRCADNAMLLFDGDAAGRKASVRTGAEFIAAGIPVRIASLPAGEDPDSFLRTHSPAEFQSRLDSAESFTHFLVRTMREAESNPSSISTVKKISSAAIQIFSKCPSAVMRAALVNETAEVLGVPTDSLREDMENAKTAFSAARKNPRPSGESEPPPDGGETPEENSRPDVQTAAQPLDAHSPSNIPPSKLETAFCEFLYENEHDPDVAAVLKEAALDAILPHPYARQFAKAWLDEISSGNDTIAALQNDSSGAQRDWMDKILVRTEKTLFSERKPQEIAREFARKIWSEAVKRKLGELNAESTPENDRLRLEYSMLSRLFTNFPWEKILPRMKAEDFAP